MRLAADAPAEERGLRRDGVRLLAATPDGIGHGRFTDLPRYLSPGDLLVVNTSGTRPAAADGRRADGRLVTVHVSTHTDDGTHLVELREWLSSRGRVRDAVAGEEITLPDRVSLRLLRPYPGPEPARLWEAEAVQAGQRHPDFAGFLARHGRPVRYSYVPEPWPLAAYQTVFAREPGSAEMASAARPFSPELVTTLVAAGVQIAPVTLHAGLASLETGEPPLPERYRVPAPTAQLVNLAHVGERRVVAVGTTVVRALESAAGEDGVVRASEGWATVVLGPRRPARVIDGLVTGWHDPEASHLDLLRAVAGPDLVAAAYAEAERHRYLWHEFGDSCLLLPPRPAGQPSRVARTAMCP